MGGFFLLLLLFPLFMIHGLGEGGDVKRNGDP